MRFIRINHHLLTDSLTIFGRHILCAVQLDPIEDEHDPGAKLRLPSILPGISNTGARSEFGEDGKGPRRRSGGQLGGAQSRSRSA